MFPSSGRIWDISDPSKETLKRELLNDQKQVRFKCGLACLQYSFPSVEQIEMEFQVSVLRQVGTSDANVWHCARGLLQRVWLL